MEGKGLAEVVHLAKEDEEEAITELLRRFDPLIMSIHHHYFFMKWIKTILRKKPVS